MGILIPKALWNKNKERIKATKNLPFREYNDNLKKAEDTILDLLRDNAVQDLTNARIKKELDYALGRSTKKSDKVRKKTFYEFYKDELEKLKLAQLGVEGHDNRRRAYQKYRDIGNKINASRMDWEDFDWEWHDDFVQRMEAVPYSLNYVGKLVGYVKAILRKGLRYGHHNFRIWEDFPVRGEEVDFPYLNEEQILAIYNQELPQDGHLDKARDNFLIGCWLGMRVGNYTRLDGEKNFDWSNKEVQVGMNKNGGRLVVPIHWMVEEIWQKNGGLPKKISDQRLNEYIKIVAEKAGLTDLYTYTRTIGGTQQSITGRLCDMVCTHTARRSLCTNLYLNDVPVRTIMACSGHSSERQCLKYVKADFLDLLKKAKKLPVWEKPKEEAEETEQEL
ncbi:tyrosine-type recombinase/integrase [Prolixibacteraceae bacterium Z1-6]|uniref:Tyrosine-type recombinase/integrase n=1 Tax=Draconibacterium aestuarii TaxID=2998507 RepID=A0A9X3F529_9BACT|nr:tyrosine-type recombinase/integrase [Prolixibacteraceae bacterium Z1-6]